MSSSHGPFLSLCFLASSFFLIFPPGSCMSLGSLSNSCTIPHLPFSELPAMLCIISVMSLLVAHTVVNPVPPCTVVQVSCTVQDRPDKNKSQWEQKLGCLSSLSDTHTPGFYCLSLLLVFPLARNGPISLVFLPTFPGNHFPPFLGVDPHNPEETGCVPQMDQLWPPHLWLSAPLH